MSLKERVYSVLVVSSAENLNKSLYELLPPAKYSPVDTVSNVNAAKRIIVEKAYDFILINAPLPDEFGSRFAIDASTIKNSIVLLLVRLMITRQPLIRLPNTAYLFFQSPHQNLL